MIEHEYYQLLFLIERRTISAETNIARSPFSAGSRKYLYGSVSAAPGAVDEIQRFSALTLSKAVSL